MTLAKREDVENVLNLRVVIAVTICVMNVEIMRSTVVVMDIVIVVEQMSTAVQKGGLVVNVKNGIAAVVEIATILVRNVVLNRSQNLRKKRRIDLTLPTVSTSATADITRHGLVC